MRRLSLALLVVCFAANRCTAQLQTRIATPRSTASSSFQENVGVGFRFRQASPRGVVFFNSGGINGGAPLGGFQPGATFGIGGRGRNNGWSLTLRGGQSSNRSSVTQTPSLMIANGGFGFIRDTRQHPFVTGIVPVVSGNFRTPLTERWMRIQAEQRLKKRSSSEAVPTPAPPPAPTKVHHRPDDPPLILGKKPFRSGA